MTFILCHSKYWKFNIHGIQHFKNNRNLAYSPINKKDVRNFRKPGISRKRPVKSSVYYFLQASIIIWSLNCSYFKTPVILFYCFGSLKDHHCSHCIDTINIGYIISLNSIVFSYFSTVPSTSAIISYFSTVPSTSAITAIPATDSKTIILIY